MGAGPEYEIWNGMRCGVDEDNGRSCDATFRAGAATDIVGQKQDDQQTVQLAAEKRVKDGFARHSTC